MEENTAPTAAQVAELIDLSINADNAVTAAIESAAVALTVAAVATFEALSANVPVRDIAELTHGTNKDTVSRLAIVGQFLTLESNYNGPAVVDVGANSVAAISKAHYVRSVVLKLIKSKVSIKDIRGAVSSAATQRDAMANLKALSMPIAEESPAGDEGGNDDESDELDTFRSALVRAATLVLEAMNALPLDASADDVAAVLAFKDTVTLFDNAFAARLESPAVETVTA